MPAPSPSGPPDTDAVASALRRRLIAIQLDPVSIGRGTPDQDQERRVASFDLIEEGTFGLPGHDGGPYRLHLALREAKLVLEVGDEGGTPVCAHVLSLTPLRSLLRDYRLICDSYYAAIRTATPAQIVAIDMGRRGLHDEAAEVLQARLAGKIEADFATFRRLFTLVAALHWKG